MLEYEINVFMERPGTDTLFKTINCEVKNEV